MDGLIARCWTLPRNWPLRATTASERRCGAELIAAPTVTPWQSLNSRLSAPADLQITVFEEMGNND